MAGSHGRQTALQRGRLSAPGWDAGLLDGAIHLLQERGIAAADQEVADLLESGGAVLQRANGRLRLRAEPLRKVLRSLPAAFGLYDRAGSKVATVAAGTGSTPDAALHAVCPAVVSKAAPAVRDLPQIARALAATAGFEIVSCPPVPASIPPVLGDLYRLYLSLLASPQPILLRPDDAESVRAGHSLLTALRGSVQGAEDKPLLIVEAVASGPLTWDRTGCRTLIDGARRAIPIAVIGTLKPEENGSPTDAGSTLTVMPDNWALTGVATSLAGILIHQLARERAPLIWGVPLRAIRPTQPWRQAWAHLMGGGRRLGLPVLATNPDAVRSRSVSEPSMVECVSAAFWAVQAQILGAQIVAWGGLVADGDGFALALLTEQERFLPEIRRSVLRVAGQPDKPPASATPELPLEKRRALAGVVRGAAARAGFADLPLAAAEEA